MGNNGEKRFKVRLEIGMMVTVGVEAGNEEAAEEYARQILNDELRIPGSSLYFCEADNSDVYVNYAEIVPKETYEADDD